MLFLPFGRECHVNVCHTLDKTHIEPFLYLSLSEQFVLIKMHSCVFCDEMFSSERGTTFAAFASLHSRMFLFRDLVFLLRFENLSLLFFLWVCESVNVRFVPKRCYKLIKVQMT